ncbi:SMI1/KNR4 family protein [Dactylosporangium sp. CA-092794]|uniref:SMI1/KNR4 family protein n=1 Tax=Dactylosporangium sp. CA-092794 TaxID=3239929 RepID=UPI003D8E92FE
MRDPVGHTWQRITRWLHGHAPATAALIRGPAGAAAVDAVERDVGTPLPADLRAWWACTDGFPPGTVEALIPALHTPLTTAAVPAELRSRLAISSTAAQPHDAEAGRFSHGYQPAFVPISTDNCGQVLFVDLRPGPWHGCVSEWDHEQGFLDAPRWRSVAVMLADIAGALESGGPALADYTDRRRALGFTHDTRVWAAVDNAGELEWLDRLTE